MSELKVECSGSKTEIYGKLKGGLQEYFAQGKIAQLKEIQFDDATTSVTANGTGFKAAIHCEDNRVVVDLDLNFLLKPMRGKIEEQITKMVSKTLG